MLKDIEDIEAEEIREGREGDIYYLLNSKDHYRSKSSEPNIPLEGEKYSLRWIRCYAKIRWAGVACMFSSSQFANEQLFNLGEEHEVQSRPLDAKLLWRAQQDREQDRRGRMSP